MLDISKKYVKSIFNSELDEESVLASFRQLSIALKNIDFRNTVLSPNILKSKKETLIIDLLQTKDEKLQNVIKLLIEKNRLEAVPAITKELEFQIASKSKVYNGIVSSKNEVSSEKIEEISSILSKKFDAKIELEYKQNNYNGVLVAIEHLGVEIGFSWDRLQQSLQDYILKAI